MKATLYIRRIVDRLRLEFHGATKVTKVCSVNGIDIQMEISNPRELSRCISYATKEPDTISWIDTYIRPGDVMYDIGANMGQYSLYAALKYTGKVRVYCFEPESQTYAALNRNIHINNVSNMVTSFCLAISDSTRFDTFNVRGNLRAGEAIHQFGRTIDDAGIMFTPIHRQGMMGVSLDDLHYIYGMDIPQCIKIDVDGLESAVIRGGTRILRNSRLRSVLIEITEVLSRKEEMGLIYETFEKNGFRVVSKVAARIEEPEYPSYNVVFSRVESS